MYADTDFFVALAKPSDWLKHNAKLIHQQYKGNIDTSIATYIEIAFVALRINLDPLYAILGVLKICNHTNLVPIRAGQLIKKGVGVLDAFHAANCDGEIISSDHIYDTIGIKRIKLENPVEKGEN